MRGRRVGVIHRAGRADRAAGAAAGAQVRIDLDLVAVADDGLGRADVDAGGAAFELVAAVGAQALFVGEVLRLFEVADHLHHLGRGRAAGALVHARGVIAVRVLVGRDQRARAEVEHEIEFALLDRLARRLPARVESAQPAGQRHRARDEDRIQALADVDVVEQHQRDRQAGRQVIGPGQGLQRTADDEGTAAGAVADGDARLEWGDGVGREDGGGLGKGVAAFLQRIAGLPFQKSDVHAVPWEWCGWKLSLTAAKCLPVHCARARVLAQ